MERVRALTKKQLETLRVKLLDEKNNYAKAEGISFSTPEGSDEVEQSITDYFNSHQLRFKNREVFYVKKVEKALRKFEKNEYGTCSDCGSWIKFERLLARPTAELCIFCKEEAERDESANFIARQSKSFSKNVDLSGMMATL